MLAHLPLPAADTFVTNAVMTCRTYEPGSEIPLECWAPEGLKDGEGAVYFFMEHRAKDCLDTMKPMMADGRIPPGIDSGGYMREHRPDAALVEPK